VGASLILTCLQNGKRRGAHSLGLGRSNAVKDLLQLELSSVSWMCYRQKHSAAYLEPLLTWSYLSTDVRSYSES
jgi:hypothetical protein